VVIKAVVIGNGVRGTTWRPSPSYPKARMALCQG
jgi:hypothetical protein